MGLITSYMARENIFDFDIASECYRQAAHAYYLKESRRTGKTLPTIAREKAYTKARRFNTALEIDASTRNPA